MRAIFILCLVTLVGCDTALGPSRTEAPPVPDGSAVDMALKGPPNSGKVYRGQYEDYVFYLIKDAKRGLMTVFGTESFLDWCNYEEDDPSLLTFQYVESPASFDRYLYREQVDEAVILVWEYADVFAGCATATSADLVAAGTGRYSLTDNDYFGWREERRNANTWSFNVHGTVMDASEMWADFSAGMQCHWVGFEDEVCTTKVLMSYE